MFTNKNIPKGRRSIIGQVFEKKCDEGMQQMVIHQFCHP
jgi:hypothetical protein